MAENGYGRGRPSKLTPEVQAKVIQAISTGNTRQTCAAYAGVDRATLFAWLAKGRAATSGLYHDFNDAVEKAEADAIAVSVGLIRRAAQTQWQAAAWWLERRYPDEWGRRDRVDAAEVLKREAKRLAEEMGLDPEEVMREAERVLTRDA